MKKLLIVLWILLPLDVFAQLNQQKLQAKTVNGMVERISNSGISIFKGIPFAAPPVGDFRWKEPQQARSWDGVRKADFCPEVALEGMIVLYQSVGRTI
jgi:para-nitrobenzyl esterase